MAEERVLLRNALVPVARVDQYHEVAFNRAIFLDKSDVTAKKPGAYLALNQIDLTGIRQIFFTASVLEAGSQQPGWYIEVRVGSPAGRLIGQTPPVAPEKEPGREAKKLSAPISATPEVQDVYFVLANNASEGPHGNIKVKDIRFSQD